MIKTLNKLGPKGTYLNIIKGYICQVLSNILHGTRLKTFPLRLGINEAFLFLSILFNILNES